MKSIKICMIIPYFGRFPNYFQLFLDSCRENPEVNWILITDNLMQYQYPDNVEIVDMTFDRIKKIIADKLSFEVSLLSYHKLCEFKPAYGYLFEEYLNGYDFWGYGDVDLIYGKMAHFLQPEMFTYDKIYTLGHFTLIRNSYECNRAFRKPYKGRLIFKEAFQSKENYNFDEDFHNKISINMILEEEGYKVWRMKENHIADICSKSSRFLLMFNDKGKFSRQKEAYLFTWNKGILYGYYRDSSGVHRKEFLYIHLQKRNMKIAKNLNREHYKIIPNLFAVTEAYDIENNWNKIRKMKMNFQYFKIRYLNFKIKRKRKRNHTCG